jgi:hypothetical protein
LVPYLIGFHQGIGDELPWIRVDGGIQRKQSGIVQFNDEVVDVFIGDVLVDDLRVGAC